MLIRKKCEHEFAYCPYFLEPPILPTSKSFKPERQICHSTRNSLVQLLFGHGKGSNMRDFICTLLNFCFLYGANDQSMY